MNSVDPYSHGFIASAQARHNMFHSLADTRQWLQTLQERCEARVLRIPLDAMTLWHTEAETGNLKHDSGRFFSITGLDCRPTFAGSEAWQQPIISQPEVGILGILTKEFAGVRYFLMQAKMEPGNINKVQLSPTLQATYSNYTQAHKGKLPPYMEYFLEPGSKVIRSQLQSETGTRFFRKFNKNILLDISAEVEVRPGYRWLTLYEIQVLMSVDNAVNMDSRSVLSNIDYRSTEACDTGNATAFFHSASCAPDQACRSQQELQAWLLAMRASYQIETCMIPLQATRDWRRDAWGIQHVSRNYFTVAGLHIETSEREVASWCQPILLHEGLGLAGFLCTEIGGVLHFLIQAKPEPGIVDSIELGPTVSVFDYRRRPAAAAQVPFLEHFLQPQATDVLHSSIQSEEGGRFWKLCNHFLVVRVPAAAAVPEHERYQWMTLAQLQQFSQGESVVNSEARTLLSCLQFFTG